MKLALLIAGPQANEPAMYNDLVAMTQALLSYGMSADQVLSLHGRLDRNLVLAFLTAAHRHIVGWTEGSLLIHVSSHGFFTGETTDAARPGLLFADGGESTPHGHLYWDDFFAALALPDGVQLILLPDL
jgi:hypothetical protein